MSNLLKVQNISKTFRRNQVHALKNVSFECDKRDVISVVGASGSGKSTLLRIIAGLEIPNEGEIILEDNKINSSEVFLSPEKRNCSLVFQDFLKNPPFEVGIDF